MSQQPPQRNNRPRRDLQNNQPQQGYQQPPMQSGQEGYYQQQPQQGQQAPQGRPMPPRPPQPRYNQPLPQQQAVYQQTTPSEPEKIYIERKSNPLMMVFKAIAFPFVKLAQMVMRIITVIIEELVRSVVSFVFGVIMLLAVVILVIGYGYALIQVDFNFVQAIPEMFSIFSQLLGLGG